MPNFITLCCASASIEFDHYAEVPGNIAKELTEKAKA
jgi:hypothetical protein